MKANEQDVGPFRIDLVLAIWSKVSRTADALHAIGAIPSNGEALQLAVGKTAAAGGTVIDHECLTRTLRLLALQDGMHAADWLRMRAVEAEMPRRKPPAPVDLQIRLRGVKCTLFVAKLSRDEEDGDEAYRVTVKNVRGDVASASSSSFANALEGALKMAAVKTEDEA